MLYSITVKKKRSHFKIILCCVGVFFFAKIYTKLNYYTKRTQYRNIVALHTCRTLHTAGPVDTIFFVRPLRYAYAYTKLYSDEKKF